MKARILSVILNVISAHIACAAEPILERIAIVDNSASMNGARSAVVRKELLQLIKQLPPSPEYPLTLVPFDESAVSPQTFTDAASAEAAIQRLTGSGSGTRIASGLDKAAEYLKGHATANVVLLLYTDGEDSHVDELQAAEDRLDQIFGRRKQDGLKQSVYVKRWGNANAALVKKLVENGNVDVIDVGELSVSKLLFEPAISVISVTRDAMDPRTLEIELAPQVRLSDKLPPQFANEFRFRCTRQGLSAPCECRVSVGGPTQRVKLRCAATNAEETSHRMLLPFEVRMETSRNSTIAALALPILLTTNIEIPITLPIWSAEYQASAAIRDLKPASWTEPTAGRIAVGLTVEMKFVATKPMLSETACRWRITPLDGLRIVGSPAELVVCKPGTYPVPLTIETIVGRSDRDFSIKLRCELVDAAGHRFTPTTLIAEKTGNPVPPPVTCSITAGVASVSKARWIDMAQEIAEFEVNVGFDTSGAVVPGERFTVVFTSPIRDLEFLPDNQLTAGRSQRTIRIQARLVANRATDLSLTLTAPPASQAIRYVVGPPLKFRVVGPAPTPLVIYVNRQPQNRLNLTVSDLATATTFALVVAPAGVEQAKMPTPLVALFTTADPRYRPTPDRIPLFKSGTMTCALPPDPNASFFFDQVFDVPLVLQTDRPTSALASTTLVLRVTREAPFRRLLLRLSIATAAILLVGTLVVLYVRLRRTQPLQFKEAGSCRTAA